MTPNPYLAPVAEIQADQRVRNTPTVIAIFGLATVVVFLSTAIGALVGWLFGGIEFFSASGFVVGLGAGFLSARILAGQIPFPYLPVGLGVIAVGLLGVRHANYAAAAQVLAIVVVLVTIGSSLMIWRTRMFFQC